MSNQNKGSYFVCCDRCLGHGHFVIPSEGRQFEVFSQKDARQQLESLSEAGLISMNQYYLLWGQVENSMLSECCSSDVEDFIRSFCETESWVTYYSRREEEEKPKSIYVDSEELALAVHEFLLTSPDHMCQLQ